ncbi:hypothetical protein Salat_0689700 [Sesamum alatum]|uniref:CCHC-type domain-containing protein n=1 Tax=Sesamum alatum TaxID=300844 RepID=A0AAE1YS57_9LAMI|nr:hypothetical protein Salat_0689700 [Sesamum alatum]
MDKVLSLLDAEVADFTIPQTTWDSRSGGFHLTLVGRLVSHRSVHFEALKSVLVQLIQATRGVSIRKISESRFCLLFNHIEDLRRVLDMRPWIFDRNLIVLRQLSPKEDPLSLNLDWCPFFVHVHDLPYRLRSIEIIRYIGGSLGSWLDENHIERDVFWFETVRIRVNINISFPLKRALQLRLENGELVVIRFSYERLPNFCYLCGKVGHISRFCELHFQSHFVDPGSNTPYGAWLWALGPMRRLGPVQDDVRPTYIRNYSTPSNSPMVCRWGVHIFGDFSRREVSPAASASEPESFRPGLSRVVKQLSSPIQQFNPSVTKGKAVIRRQLLDEFSESDGLDGSRCLGLDSPLSSAHISPASDSSLFAAQTGSSLRPLLGLEAHQVICPPKLVGSLAPRPNLTNSLVHPVSKAQGETLSLSSPSSGFQIPKSTGFDTSPLHEQISNSDSNFVMELVTSPTSLFDIPLTSVDDTEGGRRVGRDSGSCGRRSCWWQTL